MRRIIRKRRRKVKGRRRNQVTGALQLDLRDARRPFPDMRFVKKKSHNWNFGAKKTLKANNSNFVLR